MARESSITDENARSPASLYTPRKECSWGFCIEPYSLVAHSLVFCMEPYSLVVFSGTLDILKFCKHPVFILNDKDSILQIQHKYQGLKYSRMLVLYRIQQQLEISYVKLKKLIFIWTHANAIIDHNPVQVSDTLLALSPTSLNWVRKWRRFSHESIHSAALTAESAEICVHSTEPTPTLCYSKARAFIDFDLISIT